MPTHRKLFDEIVRTDLSHASYSASKFDYLSNSARPEAERVRSNIEEWFSRYPSVHAEELRARLRADQQHEAAFFELFLHEVLTRLGWAVTIHPALSGTSRRPDLLAVRRDERLLVEAATVTEAGFFQASASRTATLLDALNRQIDSPNFFVTIHVKREGPSSPSARRVAARTTAWLETLDPDRTPLESQWNKTSADFSVDENGWLIEFRVVPKREEARGASSVRPIGAIMSAGWIDTTTPLRDAVRSKATAYGRHDVAFLVAVNVATKFDADEISVMEALFGRETFPTGPQGFPDMQRQPDGAWFGPEGPRNTRNSAVLVVNRFGPWALAGATAEMYHNPFAAIPCSTSALPFPYAVAEGNKMVRRDGVTIRNVFELPKSWPLDGV